MKQQNNNIWFLAMLMTLSVMLLTVGDGTTVMAGEAGGTSWEQMTLEEQQVLKPFADRW